MPWKRQHVVYFIENQVLVAHGVLPIEAEAKPCADMSFYELLFLKCRNATMHCSEYQESGTLSILDASKDPSRFHPVNLTGDVYALLMSCSYHGRKYARTKSSTGTPCRRVLEGAQRSCWWRNVGMFLRPFLRKPAEGGRLM